MTRYTYKVIPAPAKGRKAPGVKGAEARFAHGLEQAINTLAAQGWEYLRADILPSEERQGLTSSTTIYRSVLVFRQEVEGDAVLAPAPLVVADETDDDDTSSFTRSTPPLTARREVAEDDITPQEELLPEPEPEPDAPEEAQDTSDDNETGPHRG